MIYNSAMKTIQINNYVEIINGDSVSQNDISKMKSLIETLYKEILKKDLKFHFLFEPQLIIRIDSIECLDEVKKYLAENNIDFEEYDYPYAPNGKFGETKGGIVDRYLELFIVILHSSAVAALTMSDTDHLEFLERAAHDLFNPKFYGYKLEGEILCKLAKMQLSLVGIEKCPDNIVAP